MNSTASLIRVCRGSVGICTEIEFGQKLRNVVSEMVCTVATVSPSGHPECVSLYTRAAK